MSLPLMPGPQRTLLDGVAQKARDLALYMEASTDNLGKAESPADRQIADMVFAICAELEITPQMFAGVLLKLASGLYLFGARCGSFQTRPAK